MTAQRSTQPWLYSPTVDSLFILAPSFLAVAVVLLLKDKLTSISEFPLWAWICLILCIDVAHVYSTLYRTYLNPVEFREHKTLLLMVPLLAWVGGAMLYSIKALLFWQVLAYIAVFHFIRQQYGFLRIYSRKEPIQTYQWIDKVLIYLATLYPIVYWHTHLPRNFDWFVDGDFLDFLPPQLDRVVLVLYGIFFVLYGLKEFRILKTYKSISIPKQLILLGTALSWYVGIVALNSDMVFTITNVVGHGLPYMGLIWIYGRKQARLTGQRTVACMKFKDFFSIPFLPVFLGMLLMLAYLEEAFSDAFLWREHLQIFPFFASLPKIGEQTILACVVPLLSLPQIVHYILDGFLWKLRDPNANWQKSVLSNPGA